MILFAWDLVVMADHHRELVIPANLWTLKG
jgi:hypothetical protein